MSYSQAKIELREKENMKVEKGRDEIEITGLVEIERDGQKEEKVVKGDTIEMKGPQEKIDIGTKDLRGENLTETDIKKEMVGVRDVTDLEKGRISLMTRVEDTDADECLYY